MFFNFNLNIHMLYNEIITCICPLIQKVPIDFNCTQSHFSWLNCITWHTALVQDVTHSPLPDTHHPSIVLSHSLPGVGRFDPHIIAHIFTIHCHSEGYRHPRSLNPLSPPDTLAYATPATWAMSRGGWLGALDFVLWVPGPRYAMCQWRSIPWEWWNITWRIQTQSTADLPTAVVAANTPPRKPDFARLTCPYATLDPQHI